MKRFFTRIFRFFWSWGFLKFVLFAVTLLVLLYVEENWRGARAWAATKAKWEARGESFDLGAFAPPPIPDSQNLAALPLFQITRIGGKFGYDELVDFRKAIFYQAPLPDTVPQIPHLGSWPSGKLTDMAKFRQTLATNYALLYKGQPPPSDSLAQFDAVYPFVGVLRAAAATRSSFRINSDYGRMPPAGRSLGPVTDMITLAKITTADAVLALDEKRSEGALDDMRVNLIVAKGVARDPTLVGGLVKIGIMAISEGAVYHGLSAHEWSDAQLSELEQMLGSLHFLTDYQFALRAEAAEVVANLEYFKNYASLEDRKGLFVQAADRGDAVFIRTLPRWPDGWWDNNKSEMANFLFQELGTVDPPARLAFPKIDFELSHQVDRATAGWDAFAPWKIWFTISAPVLSNQTRKFASAQVWIDETRIACALERYRLAHGGYPPALDGLVPSFIDELPHDIMNGGPYHYELRADGTFLLYSVGWNQRDDGGVEVTEPGSKARDDTQGDWVWPTPQP